MMIYLVLPARSHYDIARKAIINNFFVRRAYWGVAHQAASALESAGVEFIAENGGGPGVRLRQGAV